MHIPTNSKSITIVTYIYDPFHGRSLLFVHISERQTDLSNEKHATPQVSFLPLVH